jgi:hypothetical protein
VLAQQCSFFAQFFQLLWAAALWPAYVRVFDATPQRIGQTYLRRVYGDLHALTDTNRTLGRGLYYTIITLSD